MRFTPISKCSEVTLRRVHELRAADKSSREIAVILQAEGLATVTSQTVMNWLNGRLPKDLSGFVFHAERRLGDG